MTLVKSILSLFIGICLLRVGPDDLPRANLLAVGVIVAETLSHALAVRLLQDVTWLQAFASAAVLMATITALCWGLLAARGVRERLMPVIVAIFGCDALLTAGQLVLMPIVTLLPEFGFGLFALATFAWAVSINGFILKRALEVSFTGGVGYALMIMMIALVLATGLNPPPGPNP